MPETDLDEAGVRMGSLVDVVVSVLLDATNKWLVNELFVSSIGGIKRRMD